MFTEKFQIRRDDGSWSLLELHINDPCEHNKIYGVLIIFKGDFSCQHWIYNETKFSAMITALNFVNTSFINLSKNGTMLYMPNSHEDELPLYKKFELL